jgi:uncharacterized membrane protein YfcA
MGFILGFLIACAVGLTGVGAGSITAPVLILIFHLRPAVAVGTALTFSAVIKFAVLPVYLRSKQVDFRVLGLLCLGGVPGALIGSLLLKKLSLAQHERQIFLVLGITIITLSLANLYRSWRYRQSAALTDRARWLPPVAAVIGAEVGFSSAGAGALSAVALLSLTKLAPSLIVGTDMVFGLTVSSLSGGIHLLAGDYDSSLVLQFCVGGIAGVLIGALLSSKVPARRLRLALSVCLVALGLQLCWKALS